MLYFQVKLKTVKMIIQLDLKAVAKCSEWHEHHSNSIHEVCVIATIGYWFHWRILSGWQAIVVGGASNIQANQLY